MGTEINHLLFIAFYVSLFTFISIFVALFSISLLFRSTFIFFSEENSQEICMTKNSKFSFVASVLNSCRIAAHIPWKLDDLGQTYFVVLYISQGRSS